MKNKPNPQTFLLMAVATIAIGGGISYFQFGKWQAAQSEIATLQKTTKTAEQVDKDLKASVASLADGQTKLQHLEASVSTAAYVPSLLQDLERIGKANGLQITGVRPVAAQPTPADAKTTKPYDEQIIQITGRGTYAALQKFVAGLSTFPKIVASRTVSAAPNATATSGDENKPKLTTPILDVSVDLKAYVFKQEASVPATNIDKAAKPASVAGQTALRIKNVSGKHPRRNQVEG